MRIYLLYGVLILFLFSNSSCFIGYAIAMRDKVIYKKVWKQAEYKIKIIGKQGGFGPRYYVCEIYKKEGWFYKKISEEYFSKTKMNSCVLICSYNHYQYIEVDLCKFNLKFKDI